MNPGDLTGAGLAIADEFVGHRVVGKQPTLNRALTEATGEGEAAAR